MRGFWYLWRWAQVRSELDEQQTIPGSRSIRWGICTWIMAAGLVVGGAGVLTLRSWAILLGSVAFIVGLAVAIVESAMEAGK